MRDQIVTMNGQPKLQTKVLPVDAQSIGKVTAVSIQNDLLDTFEIDLDSQSPDATNLRFAAEQLSHSDIPVAFPTETVYGLGADATRSSAVNGIYKAKQRPADNPLIVHFASLKQLRDLLSPQQCYVKSQVNGHIANGTSPDPIPDIYKPLISRFWPGPLTIILPNPSYSPLAPEVTAGLNTFGARIPRHVLALALIKLSNVPIAAPSANASTKPSPTAPEHVLNDLYGRIETIIDGGPCDVGVESTVVDGLSSPPLILRPGGISIEQLRSCPGWENVQIVYKNVSESENQPKAPGMKYRHYSPKAPVILYEVGRSPPSLPELCTYLDEHKSLGIITSKSWQISAQSLPPLIQQRARTPVPAHRNSNASEKPRFAGMLDTLHSCRNPRAALTDHEVGYYGSNLRILEVNLGGSTADIARGIFSALRELDRENVDAIFVEGIDDLEGDTAAAVMNRLRKAAETRVTT